MLDSTEVVQPATDGTIAAREPGLFAAVRQAVAGTRASYDYTEGSIGRAVLLLAIPMVLEMLMESIFVVCDVFFVGRLGKEAVATVGLTESMMTLVYTLAIGLSIGATAMVARRIGEHDAEGAARTAAQTIALGLFVSILIGVAGALFAPQLLRMMKAEPEVIERGTTFTRVMLGCNASAVMLFLINAVFRGAGDAAIAMRVLWLANAINIILGPCLIFGLGPFPALGVTGAAVATSIGRGTGALFAFSRLLRPGGRVQLTRRHLRLDPSLMLRLARLSATGTFQVFIGMASWMALVFILASFGSAAVAGNTIGLRVIMFALLPSWGMSNAAATMVGQSLGAGKPERAEQAVWRAGVYNACFLGVVGLLFIVFAGPIVNIFTHAAAGPEVQQYGEECLRIIACGFLFYAFGMVLTQSFNGAGDTWTPTVINLFIFWLWEIPLAWVLAFNFKMGPRGVFFAVTIAFSTLAVVSALVFRRGRWKTRRV
ncbi:MAG TPA: MATE family efflux transporter [Pyrinomonadaceae bacterium]|nr:MATE family efflux transporter [Pyrinomonadaceae bacterium]